ncbi:hypothetical protein KUTeg_001429 [Tegillarca granosa]|uniref:PDZ domain-containing protein n=1 Tax=Tegillarca granosa TaxID=220873 RepID=A0ABQ9FV44_TEGGR|nr:hypothetical protein KUTeg_001429 [Tegillarca granosa]
MKMADGAIVPIQLRRYDTSQPWGFKMQGGSEVGMPLQIAQVHPNSIAGKAGLRNGDIILRIGQTIVENFTHENAKKEMIRAGNDVDFLVQREGASAGPQQAAAAPQEEEEECPYRDVQPKTYQKLQKELPQAEATGARPASIFDKRKQDRSAYTQTSGSSYGKAYGQR